MIHFLQWKALFFEGDRDSSASDRRVLSGRSPRIN
jgi:hypothetical protein